MRFLPFIGKDLRGKAQSFDGPLWLESESFVPQSRVFCNSITHPELVFKSEEVKSQVFKDC